LKPNIRRSSELELEKDSLDRALRDSYVVPIDFSIIDMENPLTQYSSAQQLSTSDEILTGAVEEKVTVIITVQPSYNSAQLNDDESRPKQTKLNCDNCKKVGLTASNNFTHPNIKLESTLRAIRTNDPARKKKIEDNDSFKSSHSFSRITASQSHLNGEESRSEKAKLHSDKCKKVVYNASKIITKPNLVLEHNKKYAAILKGA